VETGSGSGRRKELTWGMRVYVLRGDLDYHWLQPSEEAGWSWRGGVPVSFPWREPSFTLLDEDESEFVPVDYLSMNTGCDGPILSDFARGVLADVMTPAGEFWPVTVLGRRYWWFNCLAQADALDLEATQAEWEVVRGDWGEFRWITLPRRLAFKREVVARAPAVFRVPQFPQGVLFGTERLERAVVAHGLTGFKLDLVWSAEQGGVQDPAGFGLEGIFDRRRASEVARKRARARATIGQREVEVRREG
jgi:hypothetical protein